MGWPLMQELHKFDLLSRFGRVLGLVGLMLCTGNANVMAQVLTAQEYGATLLGTPCRVINPVGNKLLYQPPGVDHPVLVMNSNTPGEGGAAIFLDYRNGKSQTVPLTVGTGGWDVVEVEPGKLLFESLWPLSLVTVDTRGGKYRVESSVSVPDNKYAWQFAKDTDGGVYFGSYPGANLFHYEPKTRKVSNLGQIGPQENLYLRFVAFDAATGYLICATGMTKSQIIAYDVKTRKQIVIADAYPSAMRSAHGSVYAIIAKQLFRFEPKEMKMVPVTSPAAPAGSQWQVLAKSSTQDQLLLGTDKGHWYQVSSQNEVVPVWHENLRGGEMVAVDSQTGQMIGLRGQEYFTAKPLAGEISWQTITLQPSPVAIHFLAADPKGGVTGGPNFGQTLFRYDGARQLAQNTGQVADGGGEVYDGLWRDGKFYFVAYAGGYLGVWDPEQPWDQWHNKNPHIFVQYNAAKYGSLIRPIGGVVEGPGGKLYSGWSTAYGRIGGGLTEFDPKTQTSRVWTDEHFVPQMSIGKVAADERYIYGTTSNASNGMTSLNKPIEFWVFDPQTEKVVYRQKISGLTFKVPQTNHIWFASSDGLRRFDAEKMAFSPPFAWPASAGKVSSVSRVEAKGNSGWIVADKHFIKLQDGDKPSLTPLFKTEKTPHLAAGYDGLLYFTQDAELWSVPQ
jgi:hypothetical protein